MVDVKVVFDYEAGEEDELTLNVGDIITNVDKQEGGWWEGDLKGKRGMFPENFVEEINPKDSKPAASTPSSTAKKVRLAKVTFSYTAEQDDELSLDVGDIIEVTDEIDEGWWEGKLNGKTGVFPANFVEAIEFDEGDGGMLDGPGKKMGEEAPPQIPPKDEEPPKLPDAEKPKMPVGGMGLGLGMLVSPQDLKRQLKKVPEGKKPPPPELKSSEPPFGLKNVGLGGAGKRNAPVPPMGGKDPSSKDEQSGDKDGPKKAMIPPGKIGMKDAPPLPVGGKPPPPTGSKPPPPEGKKPPPPEVKKPPPPAGGKAKPFPPGVFKRDDTPEIQQNGIKRTGSVGMKGPPPMVPRSDSVNKRPIPTPAKPPPPTEKKDSLPKVEKRDPSPEPPRNEPKHDLSDFDSIKPSAILDNPVKTRAKGPAKNLPSRYSHFKDDEVTTIEKSKPAKEIATTKETPKPSPPVPVVDEKTTQDIHKMKKEMDELKDKMASIESKLLKHIQILTQDLDEERKTSAKQQIEIDRLKKQVDILQH